MAYKPSQPDLPFPLWAHSCPSPFRGLLAAPQTSPPWTWGSLPRLLSPGYPPCLSQHLTSIFVEPGLLGQVCCNQPTEYCGHILHVPLHSLCFIFLRNTWHFPVFHKIHSVSLLMGSFQQVEHKLYEERHFHLSIHGCSPEPSLLNKCTNLIGLNAHLEKCLSPKFKIMLTMNK